MKFFHSYFFATLVSVCSTTVLAETILKDPASVAPFQLCFTAAGDAPWPQDFVTSTQTLPFCLDQNLTMHRYNALTSFEKDFFVAVAMWQYYFNSSYTVRINTVFSSVGARFGGDALPGGSKNETVTLSDGTTQAVTVYYPSALGTLRGQNTGQPEDILVTITGEVPSSGHGLDYCVDTTPTLSQRHCVPNRKIRDAVSLLLHELNHGYGIKTLRGRKADNYGDFESNKISTFDYETNNGGNYHDLLNNYANYFTPADQHPIVFTGKSTMHYLSQAGASPYLTICNVAPGDPSYTQNFMHYCTGDCEHPLLMGGLWCLSKAPKAPYRVSMESVDLHVLSDLGYTPVLKTKTVVKDLRETLFNAVQQPKPDANTGHMTG